MTDAKNTSIPQAFTKKELPKRGIPGLVFIVSLIAVGLAGYAVYTSRQPAGTHIVIRFADGNGLQVGDPLRHRGVSIGEVTKIELAEELDQVIVSALVRADAKQVATQGTRYWIVRPEANIQGLRGLETIFSGQYIAVDPSRRSADACLEFVGLTSAPVTALPGDALEIVLETSNLGGLQPSAPIFYRGMEVGRIQSIGLSSDSRWVRINATINADYQSLIRDNSVFWNASGLKMNMGLGGLAVEANTLSSIALGGIEFATPEPPGMQVAIGHRFELHVKPEEEWRKWQPPIASGPGLRLDLKSLPMMQAAALKWSSSFYGLTRSRQRVGWVLALDDGTIIGPADLFQAPADATPDSVRFECNGKAWPLSEIALRSDAQSKACRVHLPDFPVTTESWPVSKLMPLEPMTARRGEGLLLCEGNQRYVPLEATSLSIAEETISLNDAATLPKPLHGSVILDLDQRAVVSIIIADDEESKHLVVPLPK